MAQTIKIDQLADTVMKGMEEYAKLAAEDLKKDVQKAGKTVKQQIESTAPKKTGKYSKSWAVKKTRETSDSIQIVVHSKAVPADTSFGVWPCEARWWKNKGVPSHRAGGAGGYRAADKGYRA